MNLNTSQIVSKILLGTHIFETWRHSGHQNKGHRAFWHNVPRKSLETNLGKCLKLGHWKYNFNYLDFNYLETLG